MSRPFHALLQMQIAPKNPGRFFAGCAILWGWFGLFVHALTGGSEGHVSAASEAGPPIALLAWSILLAVFVLGSIISYALTRPTRRDLANHLKRFVAVVGGMVLVIVAVLLLTYFIFYFRELPN